ncbi:MAG: Mov34/MPN/PAD-1 family protein [Candidatus Micrarchaeota archaeon]|nr:Mov34/MPN/PAD-1 family protein [Candidatus Micrarchaeota archaeon]
MFEAYVEKSVVEAAEGFFSTMAARGLEAMGLLAGRVFTWRGKRYAVAEDFVTAKNKASAVSVRFSEDGFGELVEKLEKTARKRKKIFVGWAHSHPGYGCFLSGTDVDTQRKYFPEPFHVAMVIDPLKRDGEGFMKRLYKLDERGYREASFAVIERARGSGFHG